MEEAGLLDLTEPPLPPFLPSVIVTTFPEPPFLLACSVTVTTPPEPPMSCCKTAVMRICGKASELYALAAVREPW